jgi:phosphoenolpyruvate carboxylase
MKPIEIISLTKLVKDKAKDAARKDIAPGNYTIDRLIHVKGVLTVAEDYQKTPTTTVLSKEAFALVLQYAGVTAQAAEKALIKAFEDVIAETNGKAVGAVSEEYKAIVEKGMKHVEAIVEKLPKVTCKGPITGHMQYDAVEATVELKAAG